MYVRNSAWAQVPARDSPPVIDRRNVRAEDQLILILARDELHIGLIVIIAMEHKEHVPTSRDI